MESMTFSDEDSCSDINVPRYTYHRTPSKEGEETNIGLSPNPTFILFPF